MVYHDRDSGLDFPSEDAYREAREGSGRASWRELCAAQGHGYHDSDNADGKGRCFCGERTYPARHHATALTWAWLEREWVHGMKPDRAAHIEDTIRAVDADLLAWDRLDTGLGGCVCPGPDTCAGPPCRSAKHRNEIRA